MGNDPGNLPFVTWQKTMMEDMQRRAQSAALSKEIRERKRTEEKWSRNVQLASSGKQAYVLDQQLPHDLNYLQKMVENPVLPMEARAKVLEVMILRASSSNFGWQPMDPENWKSTYEGPFQYQKAIKAAVMEGPPALFGELSKSRDQLPEKTSGRYPATEWMNLMLGDQRGELQDFKSRQEVFEPWLLGLPPQERGQAMFHLRDAIGAEERGKVATVTGFEVSGGPVGFGLQWQGSTDSHWKVVGDDMLGPVSDQLDKHPEQNEAFYSGYRAADRELPDAPGKR